MLHAPQGQVFGSASDAVRPESGEYSTILSKALKLTSQAVFAKIRTISQSHVVRPGLEVFKNRKPGESIKLEKEDIPGLAESGWNPDLDEM